MKWFSALLCLMCAACSSGKPQIVVPPQPPEVIVIPTPIPLNEIPPEPVVENGAVGIIGGSTAKPTDFPNVGWSGSYSLTLISPKHCLTAAHCAPAKGHRAMFVMPDGKMRTYFVDGVAIHPQFNKSAFSLGNDIAVVRLSETVTGIAPAALASEAPKVKQAVTLVGFGLQGTPTTGQTNGAGVKRFGDQVIDFVMPQHILWMFDKGETSSITQGDSGGPAFAKGTNTILGVASGASAGAGGKVGVWGTYVFETRVDIHRAWLVNTMATLK